MKLLLSISLLILAGCLTGPADESLDGTYALMATREDGSVETKGLITLRRGADQNVTGTWQLENVDGAGVLQGQSNGSAISFDLHPGWRDHNLVMAGDVRNGVITGRWEWIGFAGVMREGTFEARRMR